MVPIICIIGKRDSGKTILIEKIIPEIKKRGFRVGTIKHAPHGVEIERRGKDSWRHESAGSEITVLSSLNKLIMIREVEKEYTLREIADYLFSDVDIILAEGYKKEDYPKIEMMGERIKISSLSVRKDNIKEIVDIIEQEFLRV